MVCFVVYPRKSQLNHAFEWLRSVGERLGIEFILHFDDEEFSEEDMPQCVLMRGYNFELSLWFESRAVRVVNCGESMALSLDKWRSFLAFRRNGLAAPLTFLGSKNLDYSDATKIIGDSLFVVKGVFGEKGDQVWLVNSESEYDITKALLCENEFLIQEFIAYSSGRDIRVWVVGGKAVCAVVRENKDSFKSNISVGGSATKFDLTDEISTLAIDATRAVGLEIAGVDILIGGDRGYLICEINGNAGFRSAYSTGQGFVVESIVSYISTI